MNSPTVEGPPAVLSALLAPESDIIARIIAFDTPLSFWGGFNAETGNIIDHSHPGFGQCLTGQLLYLPSGRGSSSSSSVLAEAIRLGTAPAAILLGEPDPLIVTGALVASMLYGSICPVLLLPSTPIQIVKALNGRSARVSPDPTDQTQAKWALIPTD